MVVREVRDEERADVWQLKRLAFGSPLKQPPPQALVPPTGASEYAAVDAEGQLLGIATDIHHEQWWGGRPVTSAGVAGVAVRPELRGRGVARELLRHLLAMARARGAAVSSLYPTVSAPYRASGWALAGSLRVYELVTSDLPRLPIAGHLAVRPGSSSDLPSVDDLYERLAQPRQGLLTRRGPRVAPPEDGSMRTDGLTLVEDDGRLVAAATWNRGEGYGGESMLYVERLMAQTHEAAQAIVSSLASWVSVARRVRLTLSRYDVFDAVLPIERALEAHRDDWMFRPVSLTEAVGQRGWPSHAHGEVVFGCTDVAAPWNSGTWQLRVADGDGTLSPADGVPDLTVTPGGFAQLYAGVTSAAQLLSSGEVTGPADQVGDLDVLACAAPAEHLEYF